MDNLVINNLVIRHCLDPVLNKSLIEDTLALMEVMGHTRTLLYKSIKASQLGQGQPFTELELYKACMAYIQAPTEDMDTLIRYATRKRLEKDKAKGKENLKAYIQSMDNNLKAIDENIERLKEEIRSLDYKAKNIKGVQYDKQRLENVKDLNNARLTSYISKKDELKAMIKEYERLKVRIKENANLLDPYNLDLKKAYERL